MSQIINNLQVVNLKGRRFGSKRLSVELKGYAFYHNQLGFLSFGTKATGTDVEIPYAPKGGRKALEAILGAGGLINYDNVKWINQLTAD